MVPRIVALLFLVAATSSALAQEAINDGLPRTGPIVELRPPTESAWMDLGQEAQGASRPQSAPGWVEAVGMTAATGTDGRPRSVFRIRVSRPSDDYQIMFLRLFFDDQPDARPEIVA